MRKSVGFLAMLALTACASAGGQPKAYEPAPLGRTLSVVPSSRAGLPVAVAADVVEGFQFLYQFINETEFVLCLEGKSVGGRITVTGFRLARMKATNAYSVSYEGCSTRDYVGTAHNHPPMSDGGALCYQSNADQKSFELDKRAVVDIIICGNTRFLWVLKDGRSKVQQNTVSSLTAK
jgi:hypothetical protein